MSSPLRRWLETERCPGPGLRFISPRNHCGSGLASLGGPDLHSFVTSASHHLPARVMERIKLMTSLINNGPSLIQAKIKPLIFVKNLLVDMSEENRKRGVDWPCQDTPGEAWAWSGARGRWWSWPGCGCALSWSQRPWPRSSAASRPSSIVSSSVLRPGPRSD